MVDFRGTPTLTIRVAIPDPQAPGSEVRRIPPGWGRVRDLSRDIPFSVPQRWNRGPLLGRLAGK